jgi:bifunctional UDP-N-acetylglucosamine pyrophosphorylase/glucosamine-1-phosphate N-acetyltransferase
LNQRTLKAWALRGVVFQDPATTWVDVTVELSPGARIDAGVQLLGDTQIGAGTRVKAGSIVQDSRVGQGVQLGPYAHLRPGSVVGDQARIGNFVELKKATIGAHTSVAHLSYLGDAVVGSRCNIGCGFVTCNFDGRVIEGERKHKTVIEDDVFLGSDCQAIAPIRIGRGAYVASGSTLTEDVEAGALAIARARQVTKPGYARKLRDSTGQGN